MADKLTDEERNFRQEEWEYVRTSLEAETASALPEKITSIALRYVEGEIGFKVFKDVIIEVLENSDDSGVIEYDGGR